MAQSNEEEPSARPGQSLPIERHDARDVDLELADLGKNGGQERDGATVAVKAAVKEAAEGKAAGWFEFELPDLVNTPGSLQMISTLWIYSCRSCRFSGTSTWIGLRGFSTFLMSWPSCVSKCQHSASRSRGSRRFQRTASSSRASCSLWRCSRECGG